jgi:hypothetical protein
LQFDQAPPEEDIPLVAEVQALQEHGGDRKAEEFQGYGYHLEKTVALR